MKKLIILSAIALSGLIYSSANAQERFQNSDRYSHESNKDQRSAYSEHNDYVQLGFQNDHRENGHRNEEHLQNVSRENNYRDDQHFQNDHRENGYRDEQHFSYNNRSDENSNYRMRR
jgi:Ni/Co efflux regulator RcnB